MRSDVYTFLTYAGKEAAQATVYVTALIIGSTICFLTSHWSVVPFVVPLLVQVLARAHVRFRHRHKDALVELPAQKEDPVFIMDTDGRVILSVGKTRDLFEQYGVERVQDFISEEAFDRIIASAAPCCNLPDPVGVEVFSGKTLKWYEVKAAITAMSYGDKVPKVLVWFQDISLRQVYYLRLKDLLRYSDTLIAVLDLPRPDPEVAYQHLAIFLLKEYDGVYIARAGDDGTLCGFAFKGGPHGIARSTPIPVTVGGPVDAARQSGRLMTGDALDHEGSFRDAHPFDPAMLSFLGEPIRNFITFSEADVSVTAFNFRGAITVHEREFFKVVVKIFKTMTVMADLKKELAFRS